MGKLLAYLLVSAGILIAAGCSDSDANTTPGSASENPTASQTAQFPEVKIGNQVWMAKNLDVSTFRNGDPILEAKTNAEWKEAGKATKPAWCYYVNPAGKTYETYGKLYNWYAVSDPRGLAPQGWHVPTDAEWNTLINYLGGEYVAGDQMKEASTDHWKSPDGTTSATNSSGFSVLPGGNRSYNGFFNFFPVEAYFWSATAYSSDTAWYRSLYHNNSGVYRSSDYKEYGYSVRCIRD